MKGEIIQSANDKELQLFLFSTFLSTAAQGLQTTNTNNFSGTTQGVGAASRTQRFARRHIWRVK